MYRPYDYVWSLWFVKVIKVNINIIIIININVNDVCVVVFADNNDDNIDEYIEMIDISLAIWWCINLETITILDSWKRAAHEKKHKRKHESKVSKIG